MQTPLFSIVTPMWKGAALVGATIESVLAQSFSDWELIVVDDCSPDEGAGARVVERYANQDNRIQLIRATVNRGSSGARNQAMEAARGRYLAFLDSDDLWMPDKLDRQLAFMQENDYAFSCTAYEQIEKEGSSLNRVIKTVKKTGYDRLLLDCPVGNSSVMYSVAKMGKFQVPNIRKRNDDALWLTMLKKEKYIWGMPDVLMRYRIRKNSISSNKLSVVKYHWILYRDIEHLSVLRSVFHIGFWAFLKVFHIK